jgi:hypothetical protein
VNGARTVYGLGIEANVPIAGLHGLPAAQGVDVALVVGPLPAELRDAEPREFYANEERDENGEPTLRIATLQGGDYYRMSYHDGTRVVIDRRGERVWADAPDRFDVEHTATYLLGPVLGFLLRLRGTTCLHASAVMIDGRAIAFVGSAGAGKSSTAAEFARAGYTVIADDVLPIQDLDDRFRVHPAYPRLRLWSDTAAALFGDAEALPRITPGWDKRFLDLRAAPFEFQEGPVELGSVYLLEEADSVGIEPMALRDALIALVGQTYACKLLDPRMRSEEFDLLGRLVDRVPVRRLFRGGRFEDVGALTQAVVRDLNAPVG